MVKWLEHWQEVRYLCVSTSLPMLCPKDGKERTGSLEEDVGIDLTKAVLRIIAVSYSSLPSNKAYL